MVLVHIIIYRIFQHCAILLFQQSIFQGRSNFSTDYVIRSLRNLELDENLDSKNKITFKSCNEC